MSDPDPEKDDQLVITLDKYGDFSTYTLGWPELKTLIRATTTLTSISKSIARRTLIARPFASASRRF